MFFSHPLRVKRSIKININDIGKEDKGDNQVNVKFTTHTNKSTRKESKVDKKLKETVSDTHISKSDTQHVKTLSGKKD